MGRSKPSASDEDLTSLDQPTSEKSIVTWLGERFAKDLIYSRIGQDILVSVNPGKPLEQCSDSNAKTIGNAVKDGKERQAHVFELAASAYFDMITDKKDQSLLFMGETGSGKSFNAQLAIRELVLLSKSKKKDSKTSGRLLKSLEVLEAFGHAKTSRNDNGSRYGKYIEMQFNSRGKLAGAQISDYLLEKSRVTDVPYGERSFHAFYYMLAGASADEKAKWNLMDLKYYSFLAESKSLKVDGINDVAMFSTLKSALRGAGFKEKYQSQIFQLLSAILLLGNLEFVDAEAKDDAAVISNSDVLDEVSDILGVRSYLLENALVYKTKLIKKEIFTMFLDVDEASEHRNVLCQTLYNVLWSWIVESINKRLCADDYQNHIGLSDMFGLENHKDNYLHQLFYNYSSERFQAFFNETVFDNEINKYRSESVQFPEVSYADNSAIVSMMYGKPNSIIQIFDEESAKTKKKTKLSTLIDTINSEYAENDFYIAFPRKNKSYMFGIRHHGELVYYDAKDFVEVNSDHISPDFITLFRGGPETKSSKNTFLVNLFCQKSIDVEKAPTHGSAVVDALQVNGPRRKPTLRKKMERDQKSSSGKTLFSDYNYALEDLFTSISDTHPHFVLCINSNPGQKPNRFESKMVGEQVITFGLPDVIKVRDSGYGHCFTYEEFATRYALISEAGASAANKNGAVDLLQMAEFDARDYATGSSMVFLSEKASRAIDMKLRIAEKAERKKLKEKLTRGEIDQDGSNVSSFMPDDQSDIESDVERSNISDSEMTDNETYDDDRSSQISYGSEFSMAPESMEAIKAGDGKLEMQIEEEEEPMSAVRKNWLFVTFLLTWWIPGRCLEWNGMKRADIQQAWREKVALCLLIILLCLLMLFFIVGFSLVLCPHDKMFNQAELSQYNSADSKLYVSVHGHVYDYTIARGSHSGGAEFVDEYGGRDASENFVYKADLCGLEVDDSVDYLNKTQYAHDAASTIVILNPKNKKIWKGFLSYTRKDIRKNHADPDSYFVIINDKVYDFTLYRSASLKYLGDTVGAIIRQFPGTDATEAFEKMPSSAKSQALKCMNTIHFAGIIDTRDSPQCLFADNILLAATGVLVGIMVVKFLSALQLGSKGDPENYDRFVIMQVPCYTEGEENLRRTLDSLATLKYDDKRKLLFIIADGNIIGSGNDRATWRIALDLLGVDPSIDPPKLSFQSLGEGNRQHNMGKVYTGLYDCSGHLVPYIMVVKVGKDNETRRPGNRGKRDSQMILMRFLQKVHYDEPMSPLELEMFHQIKNVIGVDPSFYEFALMVDADTEVMPDALNRLVSTMVHDAKIVGLCGETQISNERDSVITMMQVYEYYISHHLAKAFESLFGSVTCLPGCFCMYRIRTPSKSIPLLTSKQVIADYSVNDVDTLHKKNLLSLGEDRYLTTLMLKHFPNMKISFTSDAVCRTFAPDRWNVLLSQRRRWINSTVHNLLELLLLPQLCGFCCFSMRFVVFFDLFATLVMPATMGYLIYVLYGVFSGRIVPIISIVLLAAGFGLQIVIFLLKRKWEHIGWLIIYILALPFFTFFIPLYAFWHFDDFSWGNTRVVVGERNGKKQIVDEEPFDPKSIPMKKWSDYESEMWEKESAMSGGSKMYGSEYSGMSSQQQSQSGYVSQFGLTQPMPYQQSEMSFQGRPMSMMPGSRPMSMGMTMPVMPNDGQPTNEQISAQIKAILATANLMTVTKKQVRDELSMFFGTDMTSKKEFINKVIEDVLQGKL
eukprot:Partr_v1_DN28871_c0_g1_i1_m33284 putative Chitin Synthase